MKIKAIVLRFQSWSWPGWLVPRPPEPRDCDQDHPAYVCGDHRLRRVIDTRDVYPVDEIRYTLYGDPDDVSGHVGEEQIVFFLDDGSMVRVQFDVDGKRVLRIQWERGHEEYSLREIRLHGEPDPYDPPEIMDVVKALLSHPLGRRVWESWEPR